MAITSVDAQWNLNSSLADNQGGTALSGTAALADGHGGGTNLARIVQNASQKLSVTRADLQYSGTDSFYMSFWTKTPVDVQLNTGVLCGLWDNDNERSYTILLYGANLVEFYVSSDGATSTSVITPVGIPKNINHHIVAVRDAVLNQIRLYIDNVLVGTESYVGSLATYNIPFIIGQGGSNWQGSTETTAINATFDDFEIGSGVPTVGEINTLFELGDDFAPTTGIFVDTPTVNQCFQIDGNDQYSVNITGTYIGDPAGIRARFAGGSWFLLDASPAGNVYDITLLNQDAGQGAIEVDFSDDALITASVANITLGEGVLITGESGPEGRLTNNQVYTGPFTAMLFKDGTSSWNPLIDPTDDGTGSFWPLLATKMMSVLGKPVFFITTADGSTGVAGVTLNQWDKAGDATSYNKCVAQVAASGVNDIRFVITELGLNDASESVTKIDFQNGISTLLDNLQNDTGFSNMKMILVNSSNYYNTGIVSNVDLNSVKLAQITLWSVDVDIFPGSVLDDLNTSVLPAGDGVHLKGDPEGQVYSDRIFANIETAFFGGTSQYPKVNSIIKTSTDKITTGFTVIHTPLQSAINTDWRMEDDTGVLVPTTAVIQNNTEILLTFSRDIVDNPVLSYGYGNDASGSTCRDSNTNVPSLGGVLTGMPLEPFFEQEVLTTISITPNVGAVEISGLNPIIGTGTGIIPNVGVIEILGFNPTITAEDPVVEITPNVGILEIIGYDPTINILASITPNVGRIVIAGFNPSIRTNTVTRPPANRVFIVPVDNRIS